MLDQPDFYPHSGSYDDLRKRMTRRMRQDKLDSQVLQVLQQAFDKELGQERAMLSRPERIRLFQQVSVSILTSVLSKIDGMDQRE
jgi:hypothetical protein